MMHFVKFKIMYNQNCTSKITKGRGNKVNINICLHVLFCFLHLPLLMIGYVTGQGWRLANGPRNSAAVAGIRKVKTELQDESHVTMSKELTRLKQTGRFHNNAAKCAGDFL